MLSLQCLLGFLASDALLHGTRTRDDANALWAKIQAVTVQKRQFCVQRRIGIFLKNLKDVARLPKKFSLRMLASKFRDSLPTETAFEVAALFCHFAPDFQRVLSPGQWAQVLQRFFRGQFDAEFTEKVAHKDPNLNVQLFSFVPMLGAAIEVPTPVSVAQMQRELTEAALDSEEKDLKWQEVKLKVEVAKWNEYKGKGVAVAMSHRARNTCQYRRDCEEAWWCD